MGYPLGPCLGPSAMANASGVASQPNARGGEDHMVPMIRHSHGCVAVDSRDRPRHSVSPIWVNLRSRGALTGHR